MKKLNVPYYSQRLNVKDPYWRPRSCGIAALKMAMDFLNKSPKTKFRRRTSKLDDLIKEGVSYGGYSKEHGWYHDGLLKIAKNHGFRKSFRKEWSLQIQNPKSKIEKTKIRHSKTK